MRRLGLIRADDERGRAVWKRRLRGAHHLGVLPIVIEVPALLPEGVVALADVHADDEVTLRSGSVDSRLTGCHMLRVEGQQRPHLVRPSAERGWISQRPA